MNIIDCTLKFYASLHNYGVLPYWFFTPIRRIVRKFANESFPKLLASRDYKPQEEVDVIVSFTSFPARIENVWQVVECMLRQTYLPKKIILWLSLDQFTSYSDLPDSLLSRIGDRFEIRLVEDDIRSHKKYYYVSKEYPDNLIFLIDDDLYYPSDILEKTYKKYLTNPNCIIGNYGYAITFDAKGNHKPYSLWKEIIGNYEGNNCFLGSGGGTLFKPAMMYQDFLNIDTACTLTPIADDIWINAMADLNSTRKMIINAGLVLAIQSKDDVLLYKSNIYDGANDRQLHDIEQYYKDYNLFTKN